MSHSKMKLFLKRLIFSSLCSIIYIFLTGNYVQNIIFKKCIFESVSKLVLSLQILPSYHIFHPHRRPLPPLLPLRNPILVLVQLVI
jgi:hypothetical protein